MPLIRRVPWTVQPYTKLPFNAALPEPVFWALPGHPATVWRGNRAATYPADETKSGLNSANTSSIRFSGLGANVDASISKITFWRVGGASDAYIEIPAASNFTWVFQTDNIGYFGTNPGWTRSGLGAGNNFVLIPSAGLWVRYNGSDFTSSVARPAAGSTVTVVVVVRSGVSVSGWVNGRQVLGSSTAVTTNAQTGVDGYLDFGRHNSGEYLTGSHTVVGLYHAALDSTTAQRLSLNVGHAYAPRRIIIPVSAGAGGGATINATGIASAEALGSPALAAGVTAAGIASAEAIGSPALRAGIAAAGVASAEAFGSPALGAGITAAGIASAEAVGQPGVSVAVAGTIVAVGISSAEAFGSPALVATISAAGIASAEAFGQPSIGRHDVIAAGIVGAEAFGTPALSLGIVVAGITSAEAFGLVRVGDVIPPYDDETFRRLYAWRRSIAQRWMDIHANDDFLAPGAGGVQ